MRDFLLSKNTSFTFEIFEIQHIIMLLITFFLFILLFIFNNYLNKMDKGKFKIIKIIIIILLLSNMFIYRFSYMYYGIYNIKIHLSLYYCHITNYLFVIALLIDYNPFYKIIYGMSWIGAIWTVLFPEFSVGYDCFILYNSFISHNLLIVLTTLIMIIKGLKYNFKDFLKSLFVAVIIFVVTYIINYDFGTRFNTPYSIIGEYIEYSFIGGYDILLVMGIVGNLLAILINKLYIKENNK